MTLDQLIAQARKDLQALTENSEQLERPSAQVAELRRKLADLQKRLEANRER